MPDLPSSLPDTNNLVEITWENGQIVMQPQSDGKPPKNTGDYIVNDLANTDVSWLTNYPSTDDYCIDILSPLTGNNTNTNNTNSPLLHDDDGGGVGGDAETSDHAISISNPNNLFPTQDPTSTCRFLNFSNFTRPVALHKTNLQKPEKLKTPNPIDNTSVVKWDEKSIIQSSKEKKVSGCLPEKLPSEMVAASSSLCSSNRIKGTITEGDESCYQSEDLDDESADCAKKPATRSSSSNKRSRTAEVHNLSERRRRDRINEKMKALQELIPNCNKVDKASMLDEAIEYLKTLQFQLQMMSTMGNGGGCSLYMPSTNMMMQPRMPHFPQMGVEMAGMGMFDVNGRPPMMRLPFQYPSSSIPMGQYQSNGVPMVGHPVSSIAHGSSYFPLPTHTTATAAATRMNFGPEVGVNTPATRMMNENSETRQKSVKLGDNDDLQKCG